MKTNLVVKTVLCSFALSLAFILPARVLAQDDSDVVEKDKLYVRAGCHFCAGVKDFLEHYNLSENIDILDLNEDPANADEYNKICEDAGIPLESRGVPLLYAGEQIYLDADEIITYFGEKYNVEYQDFLFSKPRSAKVVLVILGLAGGIAALFIIFGTKGKK